MLNIPSWGPSEESEVTLQGFLGLTFTIMQCRKLITREYSSSEPLEFGKTFNQELKEGRVGHLCCVGRRETSNIVTHPSLRQQPHNPNLYERDWSLIA